MADIDDKSFFTELYGDNQKGFQQAFGGDGVAGKRAGRSIARTLKRQADWLTSSFLSQANALNANPYMELFTQGAKQPPDGWTVLQGSWQNDVTRIAGQAGQYAFRWTAPNNGAKLRLEGNNYIPSFSGIIDSTLGRGYVPYRLSVGHQVTNLLNDTVKVGFRRYSTDRVFNDEPSLTDITQAAAWRIGGTVPNNIGGSGVDNQNLRPVLELEAGVAGHTIDIDHFVVTRTPFAFAGRRNTAQSIAPGGTTVQFSTTTEYDHGDGWDNVDQFTAPYPMCLFVSAVIRLGTGPTTVEVEYHVNGAFKRVVGFESSRSAAIMNIANTGTVLMLDTGDVVSVVAKHSGGAPVNTSPGANGEYQWIVGKEVPGSF
jgi:hypothetical protein